MAIKDHPQAVRQRLEKIEAELKAGGNFEALAKAQSEDAPADRGRLMGPLPLPGRPILQSVIDAAVKTPVAPNDWLENLFAEIEGSFTKRRKTS